MNSFKIQRLAILVFFIIASITTVFSKPHWTLPMAEENIRENLCSLDPIEGIYDVTYIPYFGGGNLYYGTKNWGGWEAQLTAYVYKYSDSEPKYICYFIYDAGNLKGWYYFESEVFYIAQIGISNAYRLMGGYNERYTHFGNSGRVTFPISSRFVFNQGSFNLSFKGGDEFHVVNASMSFIRTYPTPFDTEKCKEEEEEEEEEMPNKWSGTGFALNKGHIVTNYHVVENAKSIRVQGVKGDFKSNMSATVIATDKVNDIAIIKINDKRFIGFGTIPYRIKTTVSDVGEDVFVLGYPLTTTMGEEIKLTTGIISSKTGFQGDIALYQISAPVQPGNSGGPLFDGKGNLIGIVRSKHIDTENVGYAIKASYLKTLVESVSSSSLLPNGNTVASMPSLSSKVKSINKFVFLLECSTEEEPEESQNSIYESPNIRINNSGLVLECVIVSKTQTVLELKFRNKYSEGGWCSIDPSSYISVNGNVLKMRKAEFIETSPQKTYFNRSGEELFFKLYFPPLPTNATEFDFVENDSSNWSLYGIELSDEQPSK